MQRNRRLGCSVTGVVQAINKFGYRRFLRWCDSCYDFLKKLDQHYASRFCIPESIKITSVKPSGTVSLLAGATPGVHWEHAPFYLRRIRVNEQHPLVEICRQAGYPVEKDVYSSGTAVIGFPISVANLKRSKKDVPIQEKVDLAAQLQRYWSDNQVSCTAEFEPRTEAEHVPRILRAYEDRLKAIVFLPRTEHGYPQPPYEEISPEKYQELLDAVGPLQGDLEHEEDLEARFCEGGACEVT